MKAAPLLVAWHNDSAPIYSAHFQPAPGSRLATGGGDNNVRLWSIDNNAEDNKVTYLSTLSRHAQAVNVVRWCPKGDLLASAGDDCSVLLWVPVGGHVAASTLGQDTSDDKESWHVKSMFRAEPPREVYDLAWSPDGTFYVVGSMDNKARIVDASTGSVLREIAEHNHYVQGVAWDPLGEYLTTQSSDRSVHVYALRSTDGEFSLHRHSRMSKMDLATKRKRTSNSPAPPEPVTRGRLTSDASSTRAHSPAPSMPGTPASLPVAMPPPVSHSRRSSVSAASPSVRRSASPAAAMPLPAVMPSSSPGPHVNLGSNKTNLYASDALASFFRRLTFSPDGSLLFTPAGQFKTVRHPAVDQGRPVEDVLNTCYIYTRAGLNQPPVAHLPGHRKPSVAVRCSPIFYNLRLPTKTKNITIDTSSSTGDSLSALPEPAHPHDDAGMAGSAADAQDKDQSATAAATGADGPPAGPQSAFALPYRIVYAVATQDAVYVYDTQQKSPLCVVSNLHFATFTDLTWSNDGLTLLMTSSDGFASSLEFQPDELGKQYHGKLNTRVTHPPALSLGNTGSAHSTPNQTPTQAHAPGQGSTAPAPRQIPALFAPSPSPMSSVRPASPTRSNSASSVATQSSFAPHGGSGVINNPTPIFGKLPSVAAAQHSSIGTSQPALTSPTPPMTPLATGGAEGGVAGGSFAVPSGRSSATPTVDGDRSAPAKSQATKREAEGGTGDDQAPKKRRVAPTPVGRSDSGQN